MQSSQRQTKTRQYLVESSPVVSDGNGTVDGLARIREHAQTIRTLLEMPGFERSPLRIWRALYYAHGEYLAVALAQHQGGQINCIVQRRHGTGTVPNSREGFTDPYMQGEEMAVFLGLDDVPPDALHWVQQKIGSEKIVIASAPLPGIPGKLQA